MHPTVYLRLRHRVQTGPNDTLRLADVGQVIVDDERLEQQLLRLPVYQVRQSEGNIVVIDVMRVIRLIKRFDPRLEVDVQGSPQTIVEIVYDRKKPPFVAIVFVWLILFVGSGLAIMNFHEDVSMKEVHQRIHFLVTGKAEQHPLWLQIPYSFGIGLGMILFFNHVFRKRINDEPSPLEVEMFLYQQSLDQYLIMNENKENRRKKDENL
ncbi:stage V sporulation protein AA [Bacillaceae bacterium]